MKKIFLLLTCAVLTTLCGCSDIASGIVQNATLEGYEDQTVGEAFNNYKGFSNISWEAAEREDNKDIVIFEADLDEAFIRVGSEEDNISLAEAFEIIYQKNEKYRIMSEKLAISYRIKAVFINDLNTDDFGYTITTETNLDYDNGAFEGQNKYEHNGDEAGMILKAVFKNSPLIMQSALNLENLQPRKNSNGS